MSKIANILKRSLPFLVFGDSWLSVLGHPYALARTGLKNSLYSLASGLPDGPLLDIGCGSMPYRDIFKSASPYHGLEIDQPRNRDNPLVDFFYDGVTLPFHDQSYSVIFSSQVLEHSFKPEQLLSECRRVLKPGGTLLLTIPFMWPEHEQPWDSQRFTSFGGTQTFSPGQPAGTSKRICVGLTPAVVSSGNRGLAPLGLALWVSALWVSALWVSVIGGHTWVNQKIRYQYR